MNYALVKDGIVHNVIVVDDIDWVEQYAADTSCDAVDVTGKPVSPGQIKQGEKYLDAVTLVSTKPTIAAQGNDSATVTYTDNRPNPPASVDGTVNGQAFTLALANGVGSFDVTSANSGDTITIVFPEISLTIGVS